MTNGLLDELARSQQTHISNLRLQAERKWDALGQLYHMQEKERFPLTEWSEAVSYLLESTVHFLTYEEITKSLRPFSLRVR